MVQQIHTNSHNDEQCEPRRFECKMIPGIGKVEEAYNCGLQDKGILRKCSASWGSSNVYLISV